jgi:hypothetical protein
MQMLYAEGDTSILASKLIFLLVMTELMEEAIILWRLLGFEPHVLYCGSQSRESREDG